jgi:hypothetical protein
MCIRPIVLHRSWRNWNVSLVGIVTSLRAGRSGIPIPAGARDFSYSNRPDLLWGPSSLLLDGCWGSFPRAKWLGRDVDHSLSSSAEVKHEWSYTAALPVCLRVMDRDSFIFFSSCIVNACKVTVLTNICGWKCGWILCSAAEDRHTVFDNFKVLRGWNFYLKHCGGNS